MASIQLAATGSADIFLTGSPQVTFFRSIYKRHVSFATESIENVFQGSADFGTRSTITLQKAGDLAGSTWLQIQLPDLTSYTPFTPQSRQSSSAVISSAYHTGQTSVVVVTGLPTTGTWDYATAMVANSLVTQSTSAPQISSVSAASTGGVANVIVTAPSALSAPDHYVANVFYGNASTVTGLTFTGSANATSVVVGNTSNPVTVGNTWGVKVYGVYANSMVTAESEPVYFSSTAANASSNVLTAVALAGLPFGSGTSWNATVTASTTSESYATGGTSQLVSNLKWANNLGSAIISAVEFEIGGVRIERHTSPWCDMRQQLTETAERKAGIDTMLLNYDDDYDIWNWDKSSNSPELLFIPLKFAWNRLATMALPLVALQYHDVKINFEFSSYLSCIKSSQSITSLSTTPSLTSIQCFVDYHFLDQAERVRFASNPSEYLVEIVQFQGSETLLGYDSASGTVTNRKITLNFTQPVKELVWVYQTYANYQQNPYTGNNWFDYDVSGDTSLEPFTAVQLQLNGHNRFAARPGQYFRQVIPYQFHTRVPSKKVYCWSAALNPEDAVMPSGSINMSRLDNVQLALTVDSSVPTGRVMVYAVSWNVLRISSGMGGLVFSTA
jgi:hypothetical protein